VLLSFNTGICTFWFWRLLRLFKALFFVCESTEMLLFSQHDEIFMLEVNNTLTTDSQTAM
jgi:hypothetical protein